jgi:hypothetical protein
MGPRRGLAIADVRIVNRAASKRVDEGAAVLALHLVTNGNRGTL